MNLNMTLTWQYHCKWGAFHVVILDGVGKCLMRRGEKVVQYYDLASSIRSPFILQPILKKEAMGTTLCFFEGVDDNMYGWLSKQKDRIATELNAVILEFLQILRDIMRGLFILMENGKTHGNLKMNDVLIKDGRGKLAIISNEEYDGDKDDCVAFAEMINKILNHQQFSSLLTSDLVDFLKFMEESVHRSIKLANICRHPIFLGPQGKLVYWMCANDILDYESSNGASAYDQLLCDNPSKDWTQNLHPDIELFHTTLRKSGYIANNGASFLTYGRNVCAHANQEFVDSIDPTSSPKKVVKIEHDIEFVITKLEGMWPGFLNLVHRIYSKNSISIPVDDMWLK